MRWVDIGHKTFLILEFILYEIHSFYKPKITPCPVKTDKKQIPFLCEAPVFSKLQKID